MKKIYTLAILLMYLVSFGQLTENFDASTSIPTGWAVYKGTDGNGAAYDWIITTPPANVGPTTENAKGRYFSAPNCAFVRFEAGTLNEDWLVTKLVNLSNYTSSSLTFYAGQQYASAYGTQYKVKVSTTSQTNIASFVDVASYAEADFTGSGNSPDSNLTAQKTVNLSAYNGQQIYIAFVMIQDDGDNWSLDDVAVTGTLGTTSFDGATKTIVFPNPTQGIINIESNKEIEKSTVYDILGKEILSFGHSISELNISSLNSGVYVLKILTAEGSILSHRIVKK